MPNVLKEKAEVKRSGRKPIHPYQEWFDQAKDATEKGGSLELVSGKDYNCATGTIRHSIYRETNKRGLTAKTAIVTSDNGKESLVINSIGPKGKKAASKK